MGGLSGNWGQFAGGTCLATQGFNQRGIHQPGLRQYATGARVGSFFAQQLHQAGQAVDAVQLTERFGHQQAGVGNGEFEPPTKRHKVDFATQPAVPEGLAVGHGGPRLSAQPHRRVHAPPERMKSGWRAAHEVAGQQVQSHV